MPDYRSRNIPRRVVLLGAVGTAISISSFFRLSNTYAQPWNQDDPCDSGNTMTEGCASQLIEEFSSTSFSTTAVSSGTNYSILFSTTLPRNSSTPGAANGYRIESMSIAGVNRDGRQFSITPAIGEQGRRLFDARSASSLGFVLDHPWRASELIRTFAYTYNVVYVHGFHVIQTCTYVTAMRLADNGMVLGGVGSVTFSPPQLATCGHK